MKTYLVGGAVRDQLLGLPVQDRDWVVVGATVKQMHEQGFVEVGKDFPVFLHPQTHEEYALARTERKTAPGYKGFSVHADPDVTLEEDLARRDLTINAMAFDRQTNSLIDPYHGHDDLKNGILRHVSQAFVEDPVRILRTARFAARYHFTIAPETKSLMQSMVEAGEVDALVAERVWQELAKGLMEATPSLMFAALRECGALKKILPEIDALFGIPQRAESHPEIDAGIHTLMVLDQAARLNLSLTERFAALTHDLGKALTPQEILPGHSGHELKGLAPLQILSDRLKAPKECHDLAKIVCKEHGQIHNGQHMDHISVLQVLIACDAIRRPARFKQTLNVCYCDHLGRKGFEHSPYPQLEFWKKALQAVQAVNAGEIARQSARQEQIAQNIFNNRCEALKPVLLAAKEGVNQ